MSFPSGRCFVGLKGSKGDSPQEPEWYQKPPGIPAWAFPAHVGLFPSGASSARDAAPEQQRVA